MTNFEEQLDKTGYVVYTNVGTSMMPLIRARRDIMIIKAQKDGFKKNDAVLFKRDNGQYILHRITRIREGGYFIIGDNCLEGEEIRCDQMLGRLVSMKRDGEEISMESKKYVAYAKYYVPVRRLWLRIKRAVRRPLSKIYHKFIKRDGK